MHEHPRTWALVLAAGSGTRLQSLTTPADGVSIPKQFWSLHGGPSMLAESLTRARAVAPNSQLCVVVAEQHRSWWQPVLAALPADNIIVQPRNRGTAIGILLGLLHIIERDPAAHVLILPSDHHVEDEYVLFRAIREAAVQLRWRVDEALLLGLSPEEPDPDYGYIMPGESDGLGALRVARFIEKPDAVEAREIIRLGGLWNTFIVVSSAAALLNLYRRRIPGIVDYMLAAIQSGSKAVARLYETVAVKDFSRDILEGQEADLRVFPVPRCGWTDLGTPRRVAAALGPGLAHAANPNEALHAPTLSLAVQHARHRERERESGAELCA